MGAAVLALLPRSFERGVRRHRRGPRAVQPGGGRAHGRCRPWRPCRSMLKRRRPPSVRHRSRRGATSHSRDCGRPSWRPHRWCSCSRSRRSAWCGCSAEGAGRPSRSRSGARLRSSATSVPPPCSPWPSCSSSGWWWRRWPAASGGRPWCSIRGGEPRDAGPRRRVSDCSWRRSVSRRRWWWADRLWPWRSGRYGRRRAIRSPPGPISAMSSCARVSRSASTRWRRFGRRSRR